MKRLLASLTLALALAFGATALPVQSAVAAAPAGLELVAAPVMLATAAVTEAPAIGTVPEAAVPVIESWNPADWFTSALALAGVIAALVALIKANFLKNLHGLATLALSFGLGIGISLLGAIDLPYFGRLNEHTGMAAIMFGVNAAVIASGGWDLIKGLLLAVLSGKARSAEAA